MPDDFNQVVNPENRVSSEKPKYSLKTFIALAQHAGESSLNNSLSTKSEAERKREIKRGKKFHRMAEILESMTETNSQTSEAIIALLNQDLTTLQKTIEKTKDAQKLEDLDRDVEATEAAIEFVNQNHEARLDSPVFQQWRKEKNIEARRTQAVLDTGKADNTRAEIQETLERQFLDEILKSGGAKAHLSVPKELAQNADTRFGPGNGLQDLIDRQRTDGGILTPTKQISAKFRFMKEEFEKNGIHEAVSIEPVKKIESVMKEVSTEKQGLFGKKIIVEKKLVEQEIIPKHREVVSGGNEEDSYILRYQTIDTKFDAQTKRESRYQDYSGRYGQMLMFEIVLPKSLAEKLSAEIKKNPSILRKIIEESMVGKLGIQEAAWKDGVGSRNIPLRPPYEQWAQDSGGKNKLYFEEPSGQSEVLEF